MDNNNNNNNNNKKMPEIPEELVHRIMLISYKLSPHPTAQVMNKRNEYIDVCKMSYVCSECGIPEDYNLTLSEHKKLCNYVIDEENEVSIEEMFELMCLDYAHEFIGVGRHGPEHDAPEFKDYNKDNWDYKQTPRSNCSMRSTYTKTGHLVFIRHVDDYWNDDDYGSACDSDESEYENWEEALRANEIEFKWLVVE